MGNSRYNAAVGDSSFEVVGADQLEALSKDLKRAGNKELAKSLRKRLTGAMKPVVAEIRTAALAIPSNGAHSAGHAARASQYKKQNNGSLRRALARAVTAKVVTSGKGTSASIKLSSSKLPADQKSLPALMEGLAPWRHPIFGDADAWAAQASHPFFYKTLNARKSEVQAEVERVLDDVADQLK